MSHTIMHLHKAMDHMFPIIKRVLLRFETVIHYHGVSISVGLKENVCLLDICSSQIHHVSNLISGFLVISEIGPNIFHPPLEKVISNFWLLLKELLFAFTIVLIVINSMFIINSIFYGKKLALTSL